MACSVLGEFWPGVTSEELGPERARRIGGFGPGVAQSFGKGRRQNLFSLCILVSDFEQVASSELFFSDRFFVL